MGRNCTCCGTKKGKTCCPENVFNDPNTELLLVYAFQVDKIGNINIEIKTEKSTYISSINNASIGIYKYYVVLSKSGTLELDDIVFSNSSTVGITNDLQSSRFHYIQECLLPHFLPNSDCFTYINNNNYTTKQKWLKQNSKLTDWFNNVENHKLQITITDSNGNKKFASRSLYCIKKYTGDLNKLYGGSTECDEELFEKGKYYTLTNYNINGDTWSTNNKVGGVCPCPCEVGLTPFNANFTITDNFDIPYDNCGPIDPYYTPCDLDLTFTLKSTSSKTGKTYTSTETKRVDWTTLGRYPYFALDHLTPVDSSDIINLDLSLSASYIDCTPSQCYDCEVPCFCGKDAYTVTPSSLTYSYNNCKFDYSGDYNIDINRPWRSRAAKSKWTQFKLTISDIYFNYDECFGFTFTTQECKDIYTAFVKSFEGTYTFNLEEDECGVIASIKSKNFGQKTFPCKCFGYPLGDITYDIIYNEYYLDGKVVLQCGNPVNPANPESAVAGDFNFNTPIYVNPRYKNNNCKSSNGLSPPPSYTFPIVGGGSFVGLWYGGCKDFSPAFYKKFSKCKGCTFTDINLDMSPITYKLSDYNLTKGFDYTVQGEFS